MPGKNRKGINIYTKETIFLLITAEKFLSLSGSKNKYGINACC